MACPRGPVNLRLRCAVNLPTQGRIYNRRAGGLRRASRDGSRHLGGRAERHDGRLQRELAGTSGITPHAACLVHTCGELARSLSPCIKPARELHLQPCSHEGCHPGAHRPPARCLLPRRPKEYQKEKLRQRQLPGRRWRPARTLPLSMACLAGICLSQTRLVHSVRR